MAPSLPVEREIAALFSLLLFPRLPSFFQLFSASALAAAAAVPQLLNLLILGFPEPTPAKRASERADALLADGCCSVQRLLGSLYCVR